MTTVQVKKKAMKQAKQTNATRITVRIGDGLSSFSFMKPPFQWEKH